MVVLHLEVEAILDSAHKLTCVPEGHKCRNLHGHTYTVRVSLKSDARGVTDMMVETGIVHAAIMQFDHCYLNDRFVELGHKDEVATTIEGLAIVILWEVTQVIPANVKVHSVYVREGLGASVTLKED